MKTKVTNYLINVLKKKLEMSLTEADIHESFFDLGVESILAQEVIDELNAKYKNLNPTLLFEYPSIAELSEYLSNLDVDLDGNETEESSDTSEQLIPDENVLVEEQVKWENPSAPLNIEAFVEEDEQSETPLVPLDSEPFQDKPEVLNEIDGFKIKSIENPTDKFAEITKFVVDIVCEFSDFDTESFDIDAPFVLELDASQIDKITRKLGSFYRNMNKSLFFEYSSVAEFAEYLSRLKRVNDEVPRKDTASPVQMNGKRRDKNSEELGIAVIGMSGKFPMSKNIDEYWENILQGRDCIEEIPGERWDHSLFFNEDQNLRNKTYGKWGGFVADVDKFDPLFFKISPREAEQMDPQQRLFLETAWECLEDAGYAIKRKLKKEKVGVYVGVMWNEYSQYSSEMGLLQDGYGGPGSLYWLIANRVSYFFDLNGPSIALDTACSSSLTAIHMACQSILSGECTMALAGGVNLSLHPAKYLYLGQAKFLANDGRCRSFGVGGSGYVPGEGVGAILLKALQDAEQSQDQIHGVIRGTSINHGGSATGFTVPNPNAHRELILDALNSANVNPEDIGYIECHGTGTALGDPIELKGLSTAFQQHTNKRQYCPIGSVKSNIGHLEAAAGVAGIIKVLLCLKNKIIPKSLHSSELNPNLDFEQTPFYVIQENQEWKPAPGSSRIAALSSFGAGGANAHAVLEEYPENIETLYENSDAELILLSAHSEDRLRIYAEKLLNFIHNKNGLSLKNLAYTLQIGREEFTSRLLIRTSSIENLIAQLSSFLKGNYDDQDVYVVNLQKREKQPAFLEDVLTDKEYFELLMKRGKIATLGKFWIEGASVDWAGLYERQQRKIISLPGYPFDKKTFWIPTEKGNTTSGRLFDFSLPTKAGTSLLHPLVDVNNSTLLEHKYLKQLNREQFYIRDHQVGNDLLLPGVAYLEMAVFAGNLATQSTQHVQLKNVTWLRPIIVKERAVDVNIHLKKREDKVSFEIVTDSEDGKQIIHSQGEINSTSSPNMVEGETLSPESLKEQCSDFILEDKSKIYNIYDEMGLYYGDSFRCTEKVYCNEQEGIALLSLPQNSDAGKDRFLLHPSLMDSALRLTFCLSLSSGKKSATPSVPFSLGKLEVFGALPDKCFVYARKAARKTEKTGVDKYDIFICDINSKVLVKMSDFLLRPFKIETRSVRADSGQNANNKPKRLSADEENLSLQGNNDSKQVISDTSNKTTKSSKPIGSIQRELYQITSELLKIPETSIDVEKDLTEYGIDSVMMMEFRQKLVKKYGDDIPPTLLFDYPTLALLTEYLNENFEQELLEISESTDSPELIDSSGQLLTENEPIDSSKKSFSGSCCDILNHVLSGLKQVASEVLKIPESSIDPNKDMTDYGMDSVMMMEFRQKLIEQYEDDIPPTLLFDYPTLELVAQFLVDNFSPVLPNDNKPDSIIETEPLEIIEAQIDNSPTELQKHLRDVVSQKLKVLPDQVDIDTELTDYGFDTVMMAEFRQELIKRFGDRISPRLLLESPTINDVIQYLQVEGFIKPEGNSDDTSPKVIDMLYPLSYSQQAQWYITTLDPNSHAYNVPIGVKLDDNVDVPALIVAFEKLLHRQASLRTIFKEKEEGVRQVVSDNFQVKIQCLDVSTWSDEEVQDKISQDIKTPFNLKEGPLWRALLLSYSEKRHSLIITVHHIVFDGMSAMILIKELFDFYQAEVRKVPLNLKPLAKEYFEFVQWQEQWVSKKAAEKSWEYWKEQLKGEIPPLALPYDKERPAVQTYNGKTCAFKLNSKTTTGLKELAKQNKTTLFNVLLACYMVFLHRNTGQDDLFVGSPTLGRSSGNYEETIGFFVNMLVLKGNLSENPTYSQFLKQISQTSKDALTHQDFPFPLIVERLNVPRDPSRSPVFQTDFILQNFDTSGLKALSDEGVEVFYPEQQEGQFDLTLEMLEKEGVLIANLKFNQDLFEEDTILRMVEHLQTIFQGVIEQPDCAVQKLPILGEQERRQLLVDWNNTRIEYPHKLGLHQLFEERVKGKPDAVAAICDGESITYSDLNKKANQLANYLQELGVRPNVMVGIFMERSLDLLIGLLAILKSGGAYIPMDPSFPTERLGYMLEDSDASVIISQESLLEFLPKCEAHVVSIDRISELLAEKEKENPIIDQKEENLAYVIFTSGSTGRPKGVQIHHQAVVNFINSMSKIPGFSEKDILLSVTTISFDISILEMFLPLSQGGTVVIAKREDTLDGSKLKSLLQDYSVTVMQATPATWRLLEGVEWQGCKNLKVLCGGEPLPPDLAAVLIEKTESLWNMYGPTETTIWSTLEKVENDKKILIGRPIDNTDIYILNSSLEPAPIGVTGSLYIGGDGLSRGYLKRPDLTKDKFIESPFRAEALQMIYDTGDLARYLPDGRIECLGRVDNQVKIRGFRIELGDIESALSLHDAIKVNAVVVRDIQGEKLLVAYYVTEREKSIAGKELIDFLKGSLPGYMIPSLFVPLSEMPLTPNGKIDRKVLPEPEQPIVEEERLVDEAMNPAEKMIMSVWEEVLQNNRIGLHSDFYELGGHSLKMAQIHNKLQRNLSKNLSLIALVRNTTVAKLANYLIENNFIANDFEENAFTPVVEIQREGEGTPLVFIHPASGSIATYMQLIEGLGESRPIYGFHHHGASPDFYTDKSCKELAANYKQKLDELFPGQEVHLCGFCAGATIAFEIAQLYVKAGEKIGKLIFLDSITPDVYRKVFNSDKVAHIHLNFLKDFPRSFQMDLFSPFCSLSGIEEENENEHLDMINSLSKEEYIERLLKSSQISGLNEQLPDKNLISSFQIYKSVLNSIVENHLSTYNGDVILFKGVEGFGLIAQDNTLGWAKHVPSLETIEIPGDHSSILQKGHADILVKEMLARL